MGRFRHQSALLTLAIALGVAAVVATAQSTFKVDVKLVRLLVSVKDARGELVGSLEKPDFTVYDSGVKQEVAVFEHHTALPLIGVLADRHQRIDRQESALRNHLAREISAGAAARGKSRRRRCALRLQ